jgi:hypothetical protein
MRKVLVTALAGVAVCAAPATSWAAQSKAPTTGPYAVQGVADGTCHPDAKGNGGEIPWALELATATFSKPAANAAHEYKVVETLSSGRFVTVPDPGPNRSDLPAAGAHGNYAPGACNGDGDGDGPDNGHRIREGVTGTFTGNVHATIRHGAYRAGDGTCAGEDATGTPRACDLYSYVAYHYGKSATIGLTSYHYDYYSTDKGVKGGHFSDTVVVDPDEAYVSYQEVGDIYTNVVPKAKR